ncbi:MAG: O-methyltransferase [Anaerolineae bacterium]|nr:O-methyltransferase [Anaerolineae bacterium]
MVKKITEVLDQYVADLFAQEDEALQWIQAEADRHDLPAISIRADEGRLLQTLMLAIGAKKAIEIGALAGYSGVWMARALPADGHLYSVEKSSKHAKIVRASFEKAGVAHKADVMEGSAMDMLRKLEGKAPFDFIFIDADKAAYKDYLAWSIEHLRVGGMVTAHNAFREGRIVNLQSDEDRAMDAFNRSLANNPRLESTIIGVGDGLAVGIKKG